ncbi:hypothetical protein AB4043_09945 [Terriglobus sp. YAF25]|uniref:hypothetical protein n=1 Tax=Terriglobus sp. YAF25 TaxID=3233080 RepID=UPI003F9D54FA
MSELLPQQNQQSDENVPLLPGNPPRRKVMRIAAWIFAGTGALLLLLTALLTLYTHTQDFQKKPRSWMESF